MRLKKILSAPAFVLSMIIYSICFAVLSSVDDEGEKLP